MDWFRRNDFESDLFGLEILRISLPESGDESAKFPDIPSIPIIEAKVNVEDLKTLSILTRRGFFIADVSIDFEVTVSGHDNRGNSDRYVVSSAEEEDLDPICACLESARFPSRFYRAPFGPAYGDKFYRKWIENAIAGRFDEVCFVIRHSESVTGFITARRVSHLASRIGIFAVAEHAQGTGIAQALWSSVISWSKTAGSEKLYVATQLNNSKAVRFYQKRYALIKSAGFHLYHNRSD